MFNDAPYSQPSRIEGDALSALNPRHEGIHPERAEDSDPEMCEEIEVVRL
jgi:hypothetical protein